MTDIRIKRLALENFKCHRKLVLDLAGNNAAIYGDNATGKTSIYDALTWLLFGKDSHGNGEKNIEIKPLNLLGEVKDHDAITSVEAVLFVNGEEITLKRTYQEVWTTKRGNSEPTYDGNTSEYYIDGVPCKKFAFTDKVNELVDEETFRMLTSVSHFADGISWQDRRAVLFKVAGVMDDAQIMATDETFKPLINSMGRLSLDDYKKKLLSEKRGFVGAKTEIPARISECKKTIQDVEALDFDKARAEVEILTARRESLEAEYFSIENNNATERKRIEVREAQLELSAIENENRAYRASQTLGAVDISELKLDLLGLQSQLKKKETWISVSESNIAKFDKEIAASRERWISTNSETFTGGSCPTCGQALPAAQLKAATDSFEAQKKKRLHEIEQTANASKSAKTSEEAHIADLKNEIKDIEAEITKVQAEIAAAEANVIEPVDMANYQAKKAAATDKINALSGELADIISDTAKTRQDLQRQIGEVKAQIAEQTAIISRESLLDYSRKRVEELKEDARNAAHCLEAIEGMLFLIEEYTRYKTKFVEDSINSLFRLARFRLFREQANGGIEDRCDVVYDGIPYISVNNGAKINVGIDIINTLSKSYGVTVPLFVDNAESVTKIESSDTQIIRLIVSENDKELRVSYEN
jgi:DNA repair exonuclease SbcCD ATPase subunit